MNYVFQDRLPALESEINGRAPCSRYGITGNEFFSSESL